MSNISKTTQKLFNQDGSINTKHHLTEAEKLELMACALADVPAYNWFNRDRLFKDKELSIDGGFVTREEIIDEMYKEISKATNYLIGESGVKVTMRLPRCPKCRASVMYCDCGFTTAEDSRDILNGKVPAKFGLSKREAQMIGAMSYGTKKNKTIKK